MIYSRIVFLTQRKIFSHVQHETPTQHIMLKFGFIPAMSSFSPRKSNSNSHLLYFHLILSSCITFSPFIHPSPFVIRVLFNSFQFLSYLFDSYFHSVYMSRCIFFVLILTWIIINSVINAHLVLYKDIYVV